MEDDQYYNLNPDGSPKIERKTMNGAGPKAARTTGKVIGKTAEEAGKMGGRVARKTGEVAEKISRKAGAATAKATEIGGTGTGAAIGGAIGTIIPGAGTAAGALAGAKIGKNVGKGVGYVAKATGNIGGMIAKNTGKVVGKTAEEAGKMGGKVARKTGEVAGSSLSSGGTSVSHSETDLISPEGVVMLSMAILIDVIGFVLFCLSWLGIDDYGILDIIGGIIIGGWLVFRQGFGGTKQAAKKGLTKFLIAFGIEVVPFLGGLSPSWTILVWKELNS
jgi:hypothetical protein